MNELRAHWGVAVAIVGTHTAQQIISAIISTMPEKISWAALWTWFRDTMKQYWNVKQNPTTPVTPA